MPWLSRERIFTSEGVSHSERGASHREMERDMVVRPDGLPCACLAVSGTDVYAGGDFTAGGVNANRIAKWDGTSWSALGTGIIDSVVRWQYRERMFTPEDVSRQRAA